MIDYSQEQQDNAIEVLSDLVKENKMLKEELLAAHSFIFVQLLDSKTGRLEVVSFPDIDKEDITETLKFIKLHVCLNNNHFMGDKFQGMYAFAAIKDGTMHNYHVQRSPEELMAEFNKRKYKEEA